MSGSGSPPFDPLLSKWMEDPEYKQTAQEIWKKLDKMSISDPAVNTRRKV